MSRKGVLVVGIAVGITVVVATLALGYSRSGNDLQDGCLAVEDAEPDDVFGVPNCLGYISGVVDTYGLLQAGRLVPKNDCAPEQVTMGQVVRVYNRYLDDHPERTHESGAYLVLMAMREAWPCPSE